MSKLYVAEAYKMDVPLDSEVLLDGLECPLIALAPRGQGHSPCDRVRPAAEQLAAEGQLPDLPAPGDAVHGRRHRHGRAPSRSSPAPRARAAAVRAAPRRGREAGELAGPGGDAHREDPRRRRLRACPRSTRSASTAPTRRCPVRPDGGEPARPGREQHAPRRQRPRRRRAVREGGSGKSASNSGGGSSPALAAAADDRVVGVYAAYTCDGWATKRATKRRSDEGT